jgi:hypothetical protein
VATARNSGEPLKASAVQITPIKLSSPPVEAELVGTD